MFELNMDAIRQSAQVGWLMANSANPAKSEPEISQQPPKLARVATVAISHAVSQESAELLTARLIAAAMRACDSHGDGPMAREQMQQECIDTPTDLQADLLEHFNESYPPTLTVPRTHARGGRP